MTQTLYGIYGASGFGREVMPLAREKLQKDGVSLDKLVFVDDNPKSDTLNGYRVVTYEDFLKIEASKRHVALAIANSSVREILASRCEKDGVKLWSLSASNVVLMDEIQMGEGAILSPFVTITSNVKIGKAFHANIYSYVAHDCVIGDFVTFAPGVKCNGNIEIEDHAYLGTGAVIRQGRPGRPLRIGKGAIVGIGAVVTANVPPGVTVIGNPARVLSKENLRR